MASHTLPQAGFLGKLEQELAGFLGDAVFRVIEEKAGRLDGKAGGTLRDRRKIANAKGCSELFVMRSSAFQAARWVRGCTFNAVAIALLRSLMGLSGLDAPPALWICPGQFCRCKDSLRSGARAEAGLGWAIKIGRILRAFGTDGKLVAPLTVLFGEN